MRKFFLLLYREHGYVRHAVFNFRISTDFNGVVFWLMTDHWCYWSVLCEFVPFASDVSVTISMQSQVLMAVDRLEQWYTPVITHSSVHNFASSFSPLGSRPELPISHKLVEHPDGVNCLWEGSYVETYAVIVSFFSLSTAPYSIIFFKLKSQKMPIFKYFLF